MGDFGFNFHDEVLKRGEMAVFADHPATKLAHDATDGAVAVAPDDMHFPNGGVITPDGKALIVGETLGARLTTFALGPAGALTDRRVWALTWPRVPDGICLDAARATSGSPTRSVPNAPALRRVERSSTPLRPASAATPACLAATTARRSS